MFPDSFFMCPILPCYTSAPKNPYGREGGKTLVIQPVCVLSHVLHDEYGTLKAVEDSIVTESSITIMSDITDLFIDETRGRS
ncbi:hypothetical protein EMIT07CA2_130052 [Brevibacillus sp. IT-7CA2]